jgi:hypothetical protein
MGRAMDIGLAAFAAGSAITALVLLLRGATMPSQFVRQATR